MKPSHKIFLIISCFLLLCFSKSHATIYYITSTDSAGGLQINNAITQANSDSLKDTIYFNIPGAGPFSITLIYPGPTITKPLLIDGLSQPGNDTTLWLITLTGNRGIKISSSYCTIRGLRMFDTGSYFGSAIKLELTANVLDSLKFEQNFIENYPWGIDVHSFLVFGLALDHLTISDNKFINNTSYGFNLNLYSRYTKHLKLLRNTFINSPCLVDGSKPNGKAHYTIADNSFQNSDLEFSGHMNIVNVVRNHFFDQSKLFSNYLSLDSLIISDNYFDSTSVGVELRIEDTGNQKLYFERNTLLQYNSNGLDIYMLNMGNDSATVDGIFIRNNYFQNFGGIGIELGFASSPSSDNIIKNVFVDSNNFSNCLGILLCLQGLQGSQMSNIEIAENNIDLVQLNNGISPLINMWIMNGTMDSIVIRNNVLNGAGIEYETSGFNYKSARRIYISNNQITNSLHLPAILLHPRIGYIEHFLIDSNEISFSQSGITFINEGTAHNIGIVQNHIHHNDSCGIIFFNYTGSIDSLMVEQNIIDSNLYHGIRIDRFMSVYANIFNRQNVITNNSGHGISFRDYGIAVPHFRNLTYSQNSIYDNGLLGINIENINDPFIPLTPIFPFPVLTNLTTGAGSFTVNGYLQAATNQSYTLEFFQNTLPDSSGSGEGETYIGSLNVMTNAAGFVSYQFPVSGTPGNYYFSSTATSDSTGNTSIFTNDVDITTGINELTSDPFQIFPNPTSGKFTIQSPTEKISQITITNLSSQVVFKENFLVPCVGVNGLDLSNQAKGIYLLRAVTDKKVYNQKIIVD